MTDSRTIKAPLSKSPGQSGGGRRVVLGAALFFAAAGAAWAGLSLKQPEFRVANLLPGRVYSASQDILKEPLTLGNTTNETLDLSLQAYIPQPDQLREGAEPIPDASWLTFSREFFTMAPGDQGLIDFYISVPNDKSLLGRKFQVQFVAQTVGSTGGGFVRLGLGGRAFVTVYDKDLEWKPGEKAAQRGVRFRFDPLFIDAKDVPLGKKVTLRELLGQPLLVKNDGDYPVRVSLRPAEVKESYVQPPSGYEAAPLLKALKLSTRKLQIPPHGQAEVKGTLKMPDEAGWRKKNFYWVIVMESLDEKAPVERYERIFIRTQK